MVVTAVIVQKPFGIDPNSSTACSMVMRALSQSLMPSVFISSTGKDLADYRAAAIEVCNRLKLIPLAMEYFEAMGAGATEGSRKKLEEANVYVGIFAYRYGYVEASESSSVTEIEFDYAGKLSVERLCFLVAPHYPWPPDLIDYENLSKLQAFKERVLQTVIRAEFTTVDSFRSNLMQALVEWQQRNGPETQPQVYDRGDSIVHAAPRPGLVVGRDVESAQLKSRLGAFDTATNRNLTIVRGWPGVGKTTLVTSLAYDPQVTAHFPNGMLWVALGEEADVAAELSVWCSRLGLQKYEAKSLERRIGIIRDALRSNRRCRYYSGRLPDRASTS